MVRWLLVLVVLLMVVLAVVLAAYGRDIREARDRVASGSELVETPCGILEYARIGEGTPILLVHGAGGGYDQGLAFGEALSRMGFKVVSMSRFGYLRTPLPADGSAEAQADAHVCLLDALGVDRVLVVGASAGAASSLQLALRHPARVDGLVLLVPAIYVPRPEDAEAVLVPAGLEWVFETALRSDFLLWAATRTLRPTLLRTMFATPPELVAAADVDEQARIRRMFDDILPVSARRAGLLNDSAIIRALPRYPLESITTPTLTISFEDDLFGTYDAARYTAEHIPGAQFVGYPRGGHVWVGHHRQILDGIVQFFRSLPQPTGHNSIH
jgi:2-hydroxy-6-oxonona-2,4-dienedioate hydrolase